jgi:hypothetical protein
MPFSRLGVYEIRFCVPTIKPVPDVVDAYLPAARLGVGGTDEGYD